MTSSKNHEAVYETVLFFVLLGLYVVPIVPAQTLALYFLPFGLERLSLNTCIKQQENVVLSTFIFTFLVVGKTEENGNKHSPDLVF